ncbi:MAG: glycerol-3-phosphate dehydrogenase/oxidase [Verrucomicrobiales bacterium]|nr:glycerol-3-phosphate dehydrogenase/oxidase [Verrucomicrobiales bacterium]
MNRQKNLTLLQSTRSEWDLIIVGGGATGLATAVDAASRGHRVALVEQADFAKGTSSRSTKLVHGGVRYLKQGDISLVLEALHERGLLVRNAPHLVHPLPFVIPTYHWWEGPFYGIGLKMYDALAGELGMEPSHMLTRDEVLELLPTLETHGLTGGIIYYDGQFDDSRLAISLAQTATDHGAVLANYTRCIGLERDAQGHIQGIQGEDLESGTRFSLRSPVVINATGVFVDELRHMDRADAPPLVQPSQGVHLVLPRRFLPGDSAIMIPKTDDGRVLFAVPWHDAVILGTTDTAVAHPSLEPRALEEEKHFLLTHAARYLTEDPQPSDVLSIFAGLRPLVSNPASDGGTAALSRDHTIEISPNGLLTVTGGKWTTCRRMGQDVVDQAQLLGRLPRHRCVTEELPIHGSTPEASPTVYGTDQTAIDDLAATLPDGAERLHPDLPFIQAEVIWQARQEMARTVEDVLARRTRALLLDARASAQAAPLVARLLAQELGQDDAWQQAQVAAYRQLAAGYLLTPLDPPASA